jgi:hypothetical protein
MILGGWQTGQTFEWQPGPLLQFGNVFFYGNVDDIALENPTLNEWFDVDAGFERSATRVPAAFQERLFALRVDGLRGHATLLLNSSISRSFPLVGRSMLQIRLDAANMLNRQQFANPSSTTRPIWPRDGEREHRAAVPDPDVSAGLEGGSAGGSEARVEDARWSRSRARERIAARTVVGRARA